MAIVPCGHRVVVKTVTLEQHDSVFDSAKKAGLEIVEFTKDKERTGIDKGKVVALGATAFKDFGGDPWCKVGDNVAFARHAGKWVEDPKTKEKFLVLNDEDIVCILKE